VSNNSFVDQIAFDGMRKHLMLDFTHIDHIDLHGNVRKNPKLSGTTHNVFGIQVGVGITVAVRCSGEKRLRYHRVAEFWKKEEKLAFLNEGSVPWETLAPDGGSWIVPEHAGEFAGCVSLVDVFSVHSLGLNSNRDEWVYDFSAESLVGKVSRLIDTYNGEVDRWRRSKQPADAIDAFVTADERRIKWSSTLKLKLIQGVYADFDAGRIRTGEYRPFSKQQVYLDRVLIHRPGMWAEIFPSPSAEHENRVISVPGPGNRKEFGVKASNSVAGLDFAFEKAQCFPFYTYSPDGSNRRENITDDALEKFRAHYGNPAIAKWDIFHYIYAVLHHPAYREKFADNLKRELPRIPFAPDFAAFAAAGRELARLHVEYETLEPWPLEWVENPAYPLSYRVEDKMRLNKDKTALAVNPSLTLAGIPPETFDYRLGNRSALEWVVDQYRVTEDERSGIKSDPNREDDPQYIVRLVGQVVRVGIETVRIVRSLPPVFPG
jgi:predicted helicase